MRPPAFGAHRTSRLVIDDVGFALSPVVKPFE